MTIKLWRAQGGCHGTGHIWRKMVLAHGPRWHYQAGKHPAADPFDSAPLRNLWWTLPPVLLYGPCILYQWNRRRCLSVPHTGARRRLWTEVARRIAPLFCFGLLVWVVPIGQSIIRGIFFCVSPVNASFWYELRLFPTGAISRRARLLGTIRRIQRKTIWSFFRSSVYPTFDTRGGPVHDL